MLHEVSTRNCERVTTYVHCMTCEVRKLPSYDGLGDVNVFLDDYEGQVLERQKLIALDIALKSTPARWWGTHKKNIRDWQECRRLMWIRFHQISTEMELKYDGETIPREHIWLCTTKWRESPQQEWVHGFIHILEIIPHNWYLET